MAIKGKIYVETSIVSYLTARPSRDVVRAGRQGLTLEFWEKHRKHFSLFVSQLVINEIAKGDKAAAASRLSLVSDIPRLDITDTADNIAQALLVNHALPRHARVDALHIAVASVHQMDILLTWNCSHIANGMLMGRIRKTIEALGHACPELCTPEELVET